MSLSAISVYDVNDFLKLDETIIEIAGKELNFFPAVATDGELAPFVVYYYNPSISSPDTWWKRNDYIRYSIFDTDVDRIFRLSERFLEVLGRADKISQEGGINGTEVRILTSSFVKSGLSYPMEKAGWYKMNLDFRLCWV
jgi:hypothetical protein